VEPSCRALCYLYLLVKSALCAQGAPLKDCGEVDDSPIGEPEQSLWRLIRERKGLRELIPFGCFKRARASQNSTRLSARNNKMHKWRANRRREWKMHPFIASWPNAPLALSFTIQMQALGLVMRRKILAYLLPNIYYFGWDALNTSFGFTFDSDARQHNMLGWSWSRQCHISLHSAFDPQTEIGRSHQTRTVAFKQSYENYQ
jgi:hypothetical protein